MATYRDRICRRKKRRVRKIIIGTVIAVTTIIPFVISAKKGKTEESTETQNENKVEIQPSEELSKDLPEDLPEELIELLRKNPETEEFVLNYPLRKGEVFTDGLTQSEMENGIPLLMQWDQRWGYYQYGDGVMGLTGCGPTSLSMVASYLLNNPVLTPFYIADFSVKNGYCVAGKGTSWELMSRGAEQLGLDSEEVPLNENTVIRHLEEGNPIICIMGKGDFTDDGHFIVLTGVKDGKIKVNDPNSKIRSEKQWEFEDIKGQIKNMWVFRKK